ncbi:MAG: stage 0 sporulation family protein [Oscillospiraceae bacterium]|nr:stage 0 sporulation family protein [Oscillospiraceae bacterium]
MTEIIGVRFKNAGKTYYFSPGDLQISMNDQVIVETARGVECGQVVIANRKVDDSRIVAPLKQVIRLATPKDIAQMEENRRREQEAFQLCQEKIRQHGLDMNLVEVEYTFDNNKILFYFTADGRIDFRELVKDLAGIFRTRIELRQIGVRDESKMLGGLGICGRPFCCSTFLGDFQPVSIKMAKEQNLSLNPTKISGTCGRLMCCLKYEQEAYEDLIRITPRVGAVVRTPEGNGVVIENNLLTGMLKVTLDKAADAAPLLVHRRDVKVLGRGNRGESRDRKEPEAEE